MGQKSEPIEMPPWLKAAKTSALLIMATVKAFETGCSCEACKILREWARSAEKVPMPHHGGE